MIYLNNAATSYPKPDSVIKAVTKYINSLPLNPERSGFTGDEDNVIKKCRKNLALLFNIKNPDRVIFTSGATESLNLAIKGLELYKKHIITTRIEHNSVIRPLKHLEREGIIELSFVECNKQGYVGSDDIKKEIKENTGAIIVNHCSNVTGTVLDIKSISEIARTGNIIFIVDASQSAGTIPLDVTECNMDILVFTGHKSLYGLPGIGGIYIKEGINLKPLKVGGTGVRSDLLYQPEEVPMYYEAGTRNMAGIVSLCEGTSFILERGMNKIEEHKNKLVERAVRGLKEIPEIIIYGSEGNSIFSFNIKGIKPEDAGYILENSFEIIIRSGLHCAPLIHKSLGSYPEGSIRVSPSYFTTFEEIDFFIDAVKHIAGVSK